MNRRRFPLHGIMGHVQKIVFVVSVFLFSSSAQAVVLHSFLRSNFPPDAQRAVRLGELVSDRWLHLTISLPARNTAEMNALFQAMYDRTNPMFHHYLTPYQFTSEFGPTEEDYQKLVHFLTSEGLRVDRTYPNRMTVSVSGSVGQIEKVFNVHLYHYQRTNGTKFYAPDREPSVALNVPLEHIKGLDDAHPPIPIFPSRFVPRSFNGSGNGGNYWGNDIRAAYIPGVTLTGAGETVGIVSLESYLASDVSTYCTDTGIAPAATENVTCGSYSDVDSSQDPNHTEMSLDMEMVNTMAPGCTITAYIGDDLYAILSQVVSDGTADQVTSSYLFPSDTTIDSLLTQMALQGQSFMNAAGDGGAYVDGTTAANSGYPTTLTGSIMEDPLVTVVGGTELFTTGPGGAYVSESVWNNSLNSTGGGGGFSTAVPIPNYQSPVPMTTNNGSTSLRNIPDVACLASGIQIIRQGTVLDNIDGTSAASPLWAGFIALVNQQAVASSKPPMGFLNPSLYQIGLGADYSSDFNDVTSGNNDVTGAHSNEYSAVSGYDLATGWGSMKGQTLINDLIGDYVAPTATLSPTPTNTPPGCGGTAGASWTRANFVNLSNQGGGVFDAHDGNGPVPALFGGQAGGVTEVDQLVSGTWTAYQVSGAPLTQRTNYGVVNWNGYEWIVGGFNGSTYMNDVWRTWDGLDYPLVTNSAGFPGRDNFGLLVYNNLLWVIGGQTASGTLVNDVWFSSDGRNWTEATSNASFSPRELFAAVAFNNRMWVMGGENSSGTLLNDVWSSSNGVIWTQSVGTPFTARDSALVTVCGDDIWLMGGNTGSNSADVWISEDGANWTKTTGSASFGSANEYSSSAFSYDGEVWVVGASGAYTANCCSMPTFTPTPTFTNTPTHTATVTPTSTNTSTPTITDTPTITNTPMATFTPTITNTFTITPTRTSNFSVVYPNPFSGSGPVYFKVPLRVPGNVKIEIFSLAFRCVRVENFTQVPVGEDLSVQLVDNWGIQLANGLYYVRITTAQGSSVLKLIILR